MAGKEFRLEISGDLQILQRLQDLGRNAPEAVGRALYEEGNELLNDSKQRVPVDLGTLRNSAHVESPKDEQGEISVVVGYGGAAAPYALAVHENPRAGKTGGVSPSGKKYAHWADVGEWKYLESPLKERAAGFLTRIRMALQGDLFRGK